MSGDQRWELVVDVVGEPIRRERFGTYKEAHDALMKERQRGWNPGRSVTFIRDMNHGDIEL